MTYADNTDKNDEQGLSGCTAKKSLFTSVPVPRGITYIPKLSPLMPSYTKLSTPSPTMPSVHKASATRV